MNNHWYRNVDQRESLNCSVFETRILRRIMSTIRGHREFLRSVSRTENCVEFYGMYRVLRHRKFRWIDYVQRMAEDMYQRFFVK